MIRTLKLTVAMLFSLFSINTYAVFIDFNDLDPVYGDECPCWDDNDLTDQYIDKGLLVHGSWVNGGGGENVMTTSNWGALEFIGNFPTFVSMYVSSVYGDAIFFEIFTTSDESFTIHTSGAIGAEGTPAIPNEFIKISSEQGIRFIGIAGAYNMRMGAQIDNLTFTYASVPEPATAILILMGLILIGTRRKVFLLAKAVQSV